MNLAPIALFVYNRLWHTQQTVKALQKNKFSEESELLIFSDAPKNDKDAKNVQDVRDWVRSIKGFKRVRIVERQENFGLAKSIIDGVSEVINEHEKIIVLEDDLVTSPYFLQFINEGLNLYEEDQDVISIHGYVYPVKEKLPETFFLKGADCWGWGTWKRGWEQFEPNGTLLLNEIENRKLQGDFNFKGYGSYVTMLKDQIENKNDSWAIRWYASAFLANKYTLYSGQSLVNNIGYDHSGTHSKSTCIYDTVLKMIPVNLERGFVEETSLARKAFEQYLKLNSTFARRLKAKFLWM